MELIVLTAGAVSPRFVGLPPVKPPKYAPRGSGRRESMFSFFRYPCGGFRLAITIGVLTVVIDWP